MRGVSLLAVALASAQSVSAAAAPLLFIAGGVDPAKGEALRREALARGVDLASPNLDDDAAAEAVLAEVRPLYRDMAFQRAVRRLIAAEGALIHDRLPTARTRSALAELEVWLGACLLLDGKAVDAHDHLALARRLDAKVDADPIFPPEVRTALTQATSAPPGAVPVTVKLAPAGARLWIDGALASGTPSASPGLHYVVVERADRRPFAAVLRLPHAAPEITVSLAEAAPSAQALRQAAARLRDGAVGAEEGVAVSQVLGRAVWVAGGEGIDRFAPLDAARPVAHVESAAGAGPLLDAACRLDRGCSTAPFDTALTARRPWYRRAAVWIPISAGVVLAVGAAVLAGTLGSRSSDYVVRIH